MITGLQAQVDDLASQTARQEEAVALRQAAYADAGGGNIETLKSLLMVRQDEQREAARQHGIVADGLQPRGQALHPRRLLADQRPHRHG